MIRVTGKRRTSAIPPHSEALSDTELDQASEGSAIQVWLSRINEIESGITIKKIVDC